MLNFLENNKIRIFEGKKIISSTLLSNSFDTYCKKIILDNKKEFIIKYSSKKKGNYDPVYYEGKSIEFMYKKFPNLFPKVYYKNNNIIIIEYIKHSKSKNINYKDLAYKIAKIHKNKNNKFGFDFDTPIGGLRQPSSYNNSWVEFYGNNRLGMIFEKINKTNPMPNEINKGIEKILKNLSNLIPNNPQPSLIHGDLWEGNILFKNNRLVGLIDPGIGYAHNEMELSYLKWFKYVNKDFYNYYSELINFDNNFFSYSEVYELYYSLLNIHLWSRSYIKNAANLIKKFR